MASQTPRELAVGMARSHVYGPGGVGRERIATDSGGFVLPAGATASRYALIGY